MSPTLRGLPWLEQGEEAARAQWCRWPFRCAGRSQAVQTRARTRARTPSSRAAAVVPASTSSAVASAEMLRACQLSGVTVAAQVSVGGLSEGARGHADCGLPTDNVRGIHDAHSPGRGAPRAGNRGNPLGRLLD